MTNLRPTPLVATLTLRVAEARVEDIGHAIARLAPSDLGRIGGQPGDVLRITGSAMGLGRAEPSDEGYEGMIQIDGNGHNQLNAPYDAKVIGDYTGITPPFDSDRDGDD